MQIRDYQLGDEIKILELFDLVFNLKLSPERWKWRYRYNPAGKHLVRLMWDGDLLVGHFAVCPIVMRVNGEDVKTVHSHSLMTHPKYRGRGIFRDLSFSFYDKLENELGFKSIWGYPNNNSHYGFVKRMGWENLAVLHTMGLTFEDIKIKNTDFTVNPISRFNESHVAFIDSKISARASVYIKKDIDYLNWRFVEKPETEYLRYEFESNAGKTILIAKAYKPIGKEIHVLNIIDCFTDAYEELLDYIIYIIKQTNLQYASVTIWKNIFDKDHLALEKLGLTPTLPQTYLSGRIHPTMPKEFSNYKNWYMSMGDSDVF